MNNKQQDWENALLQETANYYPQAEKALLQLLSIPSVEDEAAPGAPFGQPVRQALSQFAQLAAELGLQVCQTEHYITIDLGDGESPEAVGILAHADVVPFGEGWHFAPTGQLVEDTDGCKIYGRGALDDKGPAVAALFALSALKRLQTPLSRPVRLIIGGNEESGCQCIKRYAAEHLPPAFGFSPDANFPVIFAEKGIAMFHLTLPIQLNGEAARLLALRAGTVVNAVPGKAVATVLLPGGQCELSCIGKAAHGSQPEKGKNAAAAMLQNLLSLPLAPAELDVCRRLFQLFGRDYLGQAAGLAQADEVSGPLTINLGILQLQPEKSQLTVDLDMRYPVTADYAAISRQLAEICRENGWQMQEKEHKAPLYVPCDQKPVTTLLQLYQEYEPNAQPIAVGGGTYCRAFANFVAFGPLRADMADVMHQADEFITRQDFQFLQRIYTQAIWRLAR